MNSRQSRSPEGTRSKSLPMWHHRSTYLNNLLPNKTTISEKARSHHRSSWAHGLLPTRQFIWSRVFLEYTSVPSFASCPASDVFCAKNTTTAKRLTSAEKITMPPKIVCQLGRGRLMQISRRSQSVSQWNRLNHNAFLEGPEGGVATITNKTRAKEDLGKHVTLRIKVPSASDGDWMIKWRCSRESVWLDQDIVEKVRWRCSRQLVWLDRDIPTK